MSLLRYVVDTLKNYLSEIIRIYYKCEDGIEKSVPVFTVWHQEACQVRLKVGQEGQIFLSHPTQIIDYFSCSP